MKQNFFCEPPHQREKALEADEFFFLSL